MFSFSFLPWLLHAWLAAGVYADFAAESLLKYSNAETSVLQNERWGERLFEEAVGPSQKHEEYVPAPPEFLRDSRAAFKGSDSNHEISETFNYGLKSPSSVNRQEREPRKEERGPRQQFSTSPWDEYPTEPEAAVGHEPKRSNYERQVSDSQERRITGEHSHYTADQYDFQGFPIQAESQRFKFEVPNMSELPDFKQPTITRNSNRQSPYETYRSQPKRSNLRHSSQRGNVQSNEVRNYDDDKFNKYAAKRNQANMYGDYSDYHDYWHESDVITDDEDKLRDKYPGFGDINTQHGTKMQDDARHEENRRQTFYEEKRQSVLKPVKNTVPIRTTASSNQDWDILENEVEVTKKQPVLRMHRPRNYQHPKPQITFPEKQKFETAKFYNYKTETPKKVVKHFDESFDHAYNAREKSTQHLQEQRSKVKTQNPVRTAVLQPNRHQNIQKSQYSKPTYNDYVERPHPMSNQDNVNADRQASKFSRYPDLTSETSAKLPSIVAKKIHPQVVKPVANFPQHSHSSAPRVSKISTRQVPDSQEEATHHLPAARGSLEAAVVAGAAGYNAQSYKEPQRLSFQIHGQEGPHSYRFGHDTGVGYNRQFRYEERDNKGVVHGRYGYYDQTGKLQIINYTADPYTGFHAEGEHVPRPEYRR